METPKKILIFSQKKPSHIFQKQKIPKKFLIFQEVTFRARKMKKKKKKLLKHFLYFRK